MWDVCGMMQSSYRVVEFWVCHTAEYLQHNHNPTSFFYLRRHISLCPVQVKHVLPFAVAPVHIRALLCSGARTLFLQTSTISLTSISTVPHPTPLQIMQTVPLSSQSFCKTWSRWVFARQPDSNSPTIRHVLHYRLIKQSPPPVWSQTRNLWRLLTKRKLSQQLSGDVLHHAKCSLSGLSFESRVTVIKKELRHLNAFYEVRSSQYTDALCAAT